MNKLLLCALKRRGEPCTAGELYDEAIALAMAAGWPRRAWASTSVQQAAALLKGMEKRGEVKRAEPRMENGREVPLWRPGLGATSAPRLHGTPFSVEYDPLCPLPQPPNQEGEDHPMHGTTMRQKFVLFDVMDSCLATYARMQNEVSELVGKHNRELADLAARTKRELLASGIEEGR